MKRRQTASGLILAIAGLLAALTFSHAAAAAVTVPAKALAVGAFVAGHPVEIICDADVNPSPKPVPPGFVVDAWTLIGTGPIHMVPAICANLRARVGTPEFTHALRVLLRESAIAGQARSESCAELYAELGSYDVLRRFYRVPFFTALSRRIGDDVVAEVKTSPPNFAPSLCTGWPA